MELVYQKIGRKGEGQFLFDLYENIFEDRTFVQIQEGNTLINCIVDLAEK